MTTEQAPPSTPPGPTSGTPGDISTGQSIDCLTLAEQLVTLIAHGGAGGFIQIATLAMRLHEAGTPTQVLAEAWQRLMDNARQDHASALYPMALVGEIVEQPTETGICARYPQLARELAAGTALYALSGAAGNETTTDGWVVVFTEHVGDALLERRFFTRQQPTGEYLLCATPARS